jgi:hypothetical protein
MGANSQWPGPGRLPDEVPGDQLKGQKPGDPDLEGIIV